jgi:hypothetical protein
MAGAGFFVVIAGILFDPEGIAEISRGSKTPGNDDEVIMGFDPGRDRRTRFILRSLPGSDGVWEATGVRRYRCAKPPAIFCDASASNPFAMPSASRLVTKTRRCLP